MPFFKRRIDRSDKTIDGFFTPDDWIRHHGKTKSLFYQNRRAGKIIQVVIPQYSKSGDFLRNRRCYIDTEEVAYVLSILPKGLKKKLNLS